MMKKLSEGMFIYDPLDGDVEESWSKRDDVVRHIQDMPAICEPQHAFHTGITLCISARLQLGRELALQYLARLPHRCGDDDAAAAVSLSCRRALIVYIKLI